MYTAHDLFLLETSSPAAIVDNNETIRAMKVIFTLAIVNTFPATDIFEEEVPEVHGGVGCRPVKTSDVRQSSLEESFCEVGWSSWDNAMLGSQHSHRAGIRDERCKKD